MRFWCGHSSGVEASIEQGESVPFIQCSKGMVEQADVVTSGSRRNIDLTLRPHHRSSRTRPCKKLRYEEISNNMPTPRPVGSTPSNETLKGAPGVPGNPPESAASSASSEIGESHELPRKIEGKEEKGDAGIDIKAAACIAKASRTLDRYFSELKIGSRIWDEETFITGIHSFAAIIGNRREEYFEVPLSGLHYPDEMEKMLCQKYPSLSSSADDFGWICPPTWSISVKDCRCTYTYGRSGSLSQGLNEFVAGPTSVDCGMCAALMVVMGIRYMIGDDIFDRAFDIPERPFRIVQSWNKSGPEGNPLYAFYDLLSNSEGRLRTTVFPNHTNYRLRHPGGPAELENTTQIDDEYFLFDPHTVRKSLSSEEVLQHLVDKYNEPRDSADFKVLARWKQHPAYVHPRLAPFSYGEMYERASESAKDEIDVYSLKQDQQRRPSSCFRFERLMACLKMVSSSKRRFDILSVAEKAHAKKLREDAARDLIPHIVKLEEVVSRLAGLTGKMKQGGWGKQPESDEIWKLKRQVANEADQIYESHAAKLERLYEVLRHANEILVNYDSSLGPLSVGRLGEEDN